MKNEEEFVNKFDDIFDIAHTDALNIIKIESDKQFLIAQRTKGWPGCMLWIDKNNQHLEDRIEKRSKNILERKKRVYEEMEIAGNLFFDIVWLMIFIIYNIKND